jgi:phosphoribosyl-AMP cyclohydrolase
MAKVDAKQLEEGSELLLDFGKLRKVATASEAVLPVAVQDAETGQVIMIAYANRQALDHTLEHGMAAFWSTSRDELWVKGATSGDSLQIVDVRVNCEQNSLLYLVKPLGHGACHTRGPDGETRRSCYYRRIDDGRLAHVAEEEDRGT